MNGRKINLEAIDDKSSANLNAAKDLVENRNVFVVINDSPFAFLTYRYLNDPSVPMIGGGFDGTYYYEKGNENIISAYGDGTPVAGITYDTVAKVMKKLGAKKLAAIGYGVSPSSSETAKATVELRGAGRRPREGLPEHRGRLRHHRRRTDRARGSRTPAPTRLPAARLQPRTSRWSRACSRTACR